jgi:transcription termination/antitermination protein NusG
MSSELQPGQQVKVLEGAFRDFIGTVAEVKPDTGKVRVKVSLFMKPVTLELELRQVKQI